MKIFFTIFLGLLISNNLASVILTSTAAAQTSAPLTLNPSSCGVSKVTTKDVFSCSCSGGSGNYDWHFYQLPTGWSSSQGTISAPKGGIQDNQIYGCKVQVTDKNTKQTAKKSIFFTLQGGKINTIVDYYFDFNVNLLVPGAGDFQTSSTTSTTVVTTTSNGVINTDINKVKAAFNGINGIGGGCGLLKLRPYLLGKGGLYQGDNTNPFLKQLPTSAQVNTTLSTGNSSDVITLIVNVVRSKVDCKSVSAFLTSLLQQIQTKILNTSTLVNSTNQIIITLQAQITALTNQISSAQNSVVDTTSLTLQVTNLKSTITQAQSDQSSYQSQLTQVTTNINNYQAQISTFVDQQKQLQQDDDSKESQLNNLNAQLADLQAQIAAVNAQISSITSERETISINITNIQSQIDSINVQINSSNQQITSLNIQIQNAQSIITSSQAQIDQLQTTINASANAQLTVQTIQAQIIQLQQNLIATNLTLTQYQAIYNDFSSNYAQFTSIVSCNLNSCYKTIYNDNIVYNQDNDGNLEFKSKSNLLQYLTAIFGKTTCAGLTTSNLVFTSKSNQVGSFNYSTSIQSSLINQLVTIHQCNVLSQQWIKSYGNPINFLVSPNGLNFQKNNFACPAPGTGGSTAYKGTIKSIQGYTAQVVDSAGKACTLYFGGSTIIQSVNKQVPQAGDNIYWLGATKPGGKSNEYNVHQCTCY